MLSRHKTEQTPNIQKRAGLMERCQIVLNSRELIQGDLEKLQENKKPVWIIIVVQQFDNYLQMVFTQIVVDAVFNAE